MAMGKAMVQNPIAGLGEEEAPRKKGDEEVEKREILKKVEPWEGRKAEDVAYIRTARLMKLNVSLEPKGEDLHTSDLGFLSIPLLNSLFQKHPTLLGP
jgi:hypothetical protein